MPVHKVAALEKGSFPGRAPFRVWVQPAFPLDEHSHAECSLLGASIPGGRCNKGALVPQMNGSQLCPRPKGEEYMMEKAVRIPATLHCRGHYSGAP